MSSESRDGVRKTALIVNDNADMLKLVSVLMEGEAWDVLTAKSAEAGLRLAREFHGSLNMVVCGCQMQAVYGSDLAAAVAALRPKLKVLLVTGYPVGLMVLAESWSCFPKAFEATDPRGLIDANTPCAEILVKERARAASA